MQQVARITDALLAFDVVQNNSSSFALLPHQLEAFISDHPGFGPGCQSGYEWYVERYGDRDESFDLDRVCVLVEYEVCRHYRPSEAIFGVFSLSYRVGFCLGWLSALAIGHRDLAVLGLDYLSSRVPFHYKDEIKRGHSPLVSVPGMGKHAVGVL